MVINSHGTFSLSDCVLHLRAYIPIQTDVPLQEFFKSFTISSTRWSWNAEKMMGLKPTFENPEIGGETPRNPCWQPGKRAI